MTTRDELNALPSALIGEPSADEAEHFFNCLICGQSVDMRRLGDVLHHEDDGHAPLAVN